MPDGCARITGNPEVISSPVGLVPTNALVLTNPINSRLVLVLYLKRPRVKIYRSDVL